MDSNNPTGKALTARLLDVSAELPRRVNLPDVTGRTALHRFCRPRRVPLIFVARPGRLGRDELSNKSEANRTLLRPGHCNFRVPIGQSKGDLVKRLR